MQHTQTDDYLLLHLSLNRITFLSCQEKKILAKKLDSFNTLALLSIEEILNFTGHQDTKRMQWNGVENLRMAQRALHYCRLLRVQIILNDDEEYPELLRQISDPPYLLFCRGNKSLLTEPSVSIVGTRKLTQAGKTAARSFAYDAAMNGVNVVSGLANGADGFAHQGVIDAYFDMMEKNTGADDMARLGKTIAVIPSGIDEITPGNHRRLAAQILQCGGCIISEYEPKLEMANWHFVGRNRIIAGLSPATLVIEAPAGSGALITADFAVEYDRDLFFHKSGFSQAAKLIAENTQCQLEADFAAGKVSKYKLENTVARYLKAGALVIADYNDYCRALTEAPGERSVGGNEPVQGELF